MSVFWYKLDKWPCVTSGPYFMSPHVNGLSERCPRWQPQCRDARGCTALGVDEKEGGSYPILWGHMSTAFREMPKMTTSVQRCKRSFCLWGGQEGRRFLPLVPVAGVALGSQGDMHTNGMGSRGRRAIGRSGQRSRLSIIHTCWALFRKFFIEHIFSNKIILSCIW